MVFSIGSLFTHLVRRFYFFCEKNGFTSNSPAAEKSADLAELEKNMTAKEAAMKEC